jgi:hypothetical protein
MLVTNRFIVTVTVTALLVVLVGLFLGSFLQVQESSALFLVGTGLPTIYVWTMTLLFMPTRGYKERIARNGGTFDYLAPPAATDAQAAGPGGSAPTAAAAADSVPQWGLRAMPPPPPLPSRTLQQQQQQSQPPPPPQQQQQQQQQQQPYSDEAPEDLADADEIEVVTAPAQR